MSTVYVLRAKGTNLCKIGFDVEERRRALQTGCPHELVVELTFEGTVEDERRAHATHQERRRVGEWFDLAEDQVRFLPMRVERQRDEESGLAERDELASLRRRFKNAFGVAHENGSQISKESILLFCETATALAFNSDLNGQSNGCLMCGAGASWMGNDDELLEDALLDNPITSFGHAHDCPVPWLQRAEEAIRRGRL